MRKIRMISRSEARKAFRRECERLRKRYRVTPELLRALLPFWKRFRKAEVKFNRSVGKIERDMQKKLKKPLLEFVHSDVGAAIGTPAYGSDVMRLIHDSELDEGHLEESFGKS